MKMGVFASGAVVGIASLLAAPAAKAGGNRYDKCSSFNPTVRVVEGACFVQSPDGAGGCQPDGDYFGIKYEVTGSLDHIATVVTANNDVVSVPSIQVYDGCGTSGGGDPVTGLGKYSCHQKTLKVNTWFDTNTYFWVVVAGGPKKLLQQSVAMKKGSCTTSVAIDGLGLDVPPAAQVTEILTHENPDTKKKCSVKFTLDSVGGNVVSAKLVDSDPTCTLQIGDATDIEVTFPGSNTVHPLKFGVGYFESGSQSCTTRVIGGRVYTWGSPCPE
jgi:hypothetical protein